MKKESRRAESVFLAFITAMAILLGTTVLADAFRSSQIYNKSRIIRMIVTQDQINITDMAGNKRNVDMMLKFVGALTSAYINFEMIPVGEVSTFVSVFESIPSDVTITKFEYHRKNLHITGMASNEESYTSFLQSLRDTEHFASVSGHFYLSTDNHIQFQMECLAQAASVHLEF